MRIAFLLYDFDVGGMPGWVYRLATRLSVRHELHFLCTHVDRVAPQFYDVGHPVFLGKRWWALVSYLRRHRIDLVQYGQHRVFGECALAAGVPVVIERTDGYRDGALAHSKRGLDAVIASSQGTGRYLERLIARERIHVIYNGVDVAQMQQAAPDRLGYPDSDVIIGRVSRFGQGKNLGLLIEAMRRLRGRLPHVRLVLVGGNSRMPGAEDCLAQLKAKAAGLEPWIRFVEPTDRPERLVAGFDIGTCVSRQGNEGIPNSLMECMAAGKPVVATAVDDIPELVVHGDHGFLVEDGNLEQLVHALHTLVTDAELRARLGRQAQRRIAERFQLDRQAAAYETLYHQLVEASARRGMARRLARAASRSEARLRLAARPYYGTTAQTRRPRGAG